MEFNLTERTILLCLAGSRAYGINHDQSDVDVRGIAVATPEYYFGASKNFEQCDSKEHVNRTLRELATPEFIELMDRVGSEGVIYDLRKFIRLATDTNPNILDVLFCTDDAVIFSNGVGQALRANRDLFVSKRAHHTYVGYAVSQLRRMRGHREWLTQPSEEPPKREDFGLTPTTPRNFSVVDAMIRSKMNDWNFDFTGVPEPTRLDIMEKVHQTLLEMGTDYRSESRWVKACEHMDFSPELERMIIREKEYQVALNRYKQYQEWKVKRNKDRAAMESVHGYDVKHAAHLYRLLAMCREILESGQVNVNRRGIDAETILDIRAGKWEYDRLMEFAESEKTALEALAKTSTIPDVPRIREIDALCVDLMKRSL
jgi:predicted nucleotidyltransferase